MPIPKDPEKRKLWSQRQSESRKNQIPWNKGKKTGQIPWNKGKTGVYSEETLKLMRLGAQLGGLLGGIRGEHHTEEARHKMSEAQRGKRHTEETKRKMSEARKGEKNPNFGKSPNIETREKIRRANRGKHYSPHTEFPKGVVPWNKGKTGVYSEETLKLMSKNNARFNKGRSSSESTRRKISEATYGKYVSPETWDKLSKAHRIDQGLTPLAEIIRRTVTYKLWRKAVFIRDRFQCQDCGGIGGRLNAHHPRTFVKLLEDYKITSYGQAIRTEELFDIGLGITLCIKCHKKRHQRRSQTLEENEDLSSHWHSTRRNKTISNLERVKEISR